MLRGKTTTACQSRDELGGAKAQRRTAAITFYDAWNGSLGWHRHGKCFDAAQAMRFRRGPLPGMAADVVDDAGRSVRNQVRELVIRQPWIGMTRGFWKDPELYIQAYWSRFPKVWANGDWAAIDPDQLWYILGRSDDTIKIAGKRVGPAEIESILVSHPAVSEAAAIGVPDPVRGEAVICFCVLKPAQKGDAVLGRGAQRESGPLSRQAPQARGCEICRRSAAKTRNAKLMRQVIRAVYTGVRRPEISLPWKIHNV